MVKPRFVMIAGPNGAGKSTSARALLETSGQLIPMINADVIAEGLSGFSPESAAMKAGRIMVERIRELADAQQSFAVETTLASRSYASLISNKLKDHDTTLIFLHLRDVNTAIERVKHRVELGGHQIPETTIRKRYTLGLKNFFQMYRQLVDHWYFYDNSGTQPDLWALASEKQRSQSDSFINLEKQYGA